MDLLSVTVWIGLAIIGGVLGNAAWDFIRPHASSKLFTPLYRIITLNVKKAEDAIYRRVSTGDDGLGRLGSICSVVLFSSILFYTAASSVAFLIGVPSGSTVASHFGFSGGAWIGISILALTASISLVAVLRELFVSLLAREFIAYANQYISILSPVLTSGGERLIRSKLSALNSRSDWEALLNDLSAIRNSAYSETSSIPITR